MLFLAAITFSFQGKDIQTELDFFLFISFLKMTISKEFGNPYARNLRNLSQIAHIFVQNTSNLKTFVEIRWLIAARHPGGSIG